MTQLTEVIWAACILTLVVIFGSEDPLKEPHRIDVCLVASGPNAEDVTTNLWSDQIEIYFEKYPGSYCGRCGKEIKCPED